MAALKVHCLELGPIETNSYIVCNEDTKQALLIDPSDGADKIIRVLEDGNYTPVAIYITHGHDDHFGSVNELKRKYGLLVYIMKEEEEFVESILYNLSQDFGHPRVIEPDMFFIDGQTVRVLDTEMKALLTPGHTVGGACYYFPEEKMVFTGDTLFRGSIGRSDFPGGDYKTLLHSLCEVLMKLPDDVTVYPGHGPASSIGEERKYNPFV